jgi:hypothetical protein
LKETHSLTFNNFHNPFDPHHVVIIDYCSISVGYIRLLSSGHQFHQYQQNEQPLFILIELTKHKKTTTCSVGDPGNVLGQAQNVVGLNRLMGYQTFSLDNWMSNGNTYKNKLVYYTLHYLPRENNTPRVNNYDVHLKCRQ